MVGLPSFLARRFPYPSRLVDAGALRLRVYEHGRGLPVVLLHGNPTWSWLWRKVVERLDPALYRVVMVDLAGLGFSERPPAHADHTLANHVGWMGRVFGQLDLEGAIFAGQDWGGPIGLGALASAGIQPRGLVLANTVIGPPRKGFRASAFHRFARLPVVSDVAFRLCAFPQAMLGIAQGDRRSLWFDPAYLAPLADPRHNAAPLALARMVPDSDWHPSIAVLADIERFVAACDVPIELVWGTRDPILGRVVNHLERALPHARVTCTRGGHFLPEEEPEAIANAIARITSVQPSNR
jgi:haloalkane dehalogenase